MNVTNPGEELTDVAKPTEEGDSMPEETSDTIPEELPQEKSASVETSAV